MKIARLLFATLLPLVAARSYAADFPSWMAGSWASPSGEGMEEHWTHPAGDIMLGMHRDLHASGKSSFEFLRIERREGTLVYLAMPAGRPATPFPLKETTASRITFENPQHDFPQRIIYWIEGRKRLCARVEGTIKGKDESEQWCWGAHPSEIIAGARIAGRGGGLKGIEDEGFGVTENVLRDSECDDLLSCVTAADVQRGRAGARHLLSMARIAELVSDSRLRDIAGAALGGEPRPFRVTLFDKSAGSNWSVAWHQDTAVPLRERFDATGWGPWSVKEGVLFAQAPASALRGIIALRVHLDDSTSTNGPLRVLPSTHRLGVLSDHDLAAIQRSLSPLSCPVPRGGVLAMRPLLVHSSSRILIPLPRRVLHIEYAHDLRLAPGISLAAA